MKTDAAVLLGLIEEMQSGFPASDKATYTTLWQFNKKNSGDFNVMLIVGDCCGRLRGFIELIPKTTDAHKQAFLSAIKTFEDNFNLKNMGIPWKQFLDQLSNPVHVQALHFLDYMVQSQEFWRSREVDVVDADSLLDELQEFVYKMSIPEYLKGILKNDIAKLRYILKNYERFGEQDYWEKFQKVTGLFGSLLTTLDDEARAQASPVLNKMIQRVTTGISVGANVMQIATGIIGFLPKA